MKHYDFILLELFQDTSLLWSEIHSDSDSSF